MEKFKQWFQDWDTSRKWEQGKECFLKQSKWFQLMTAATVLFVIVASYFIWALSPINSADKIEKEFIVRNGESAYEVADQLYNQGIIKNSRALKIFFRLFYSSEEMQSGKYKLSTDMSGLSILKDLVSGKGKSYVVITIPEGYTVDQIAKLLEENQIGSAENFKRLAKTTKNPFLSSEPSSDVIYPLEGYLFPDTYHLYLEKPAEEELISAMLDNFDIKTKDLRADLEPDMTLEEWVILASLVEREVRKQDEQEVVAGIFWKRLHINMALQSCASIQYILGEQKLELTIADTQIPSPYNTYLHAGLTPGPVSNPGLAALKASLHPKDTEELFFVARPDGGHIFSRTYEEHLAAIQSLE